MGWSAQSCRCPIVGPMRDPVKSVRLRLSRNVQHVRRLRGLSQERLAELAAISLKQIGRVERGEVNVTLDVVARIAAGLRVDLCDLLESDTDRNAVVLVPAQDLESVEKLLRVIERARNSRSQTRRSRSR